MNAHLTRFGRAALCAAALLVAPSAGQAAVLLPGTTVLLTPADILATPIGLVEDSIKQSFLTDSTAGSLTAAVVRNAGGTLDFYYQITNSTSSTEDLLRNVNSSFALPSMEFITEVFYRTDAVGSPAGLFTAGSGGATPTTADRSANARRVGFNFSAIDPGETSRILVIRTNATDFTNGVSTVSEELLLSEGTFDSVGTFQPASAIPEPASLLLLSSAFGAAGYMARRRARQRKPGSA